MERSRFVNDYQILAQGKSQLTYTRILQEARVISYLVLLKVSFRYKGDIGREVGVININLQVTKYIDLGVDEIILGDRNDGHREKSNRKKGGGFKNYKNWSKRREENYRSLVSLKPWEK